MHLDGFPSAVLWLLLAASAAAQTSAQTATQAAAPQLSGFPWQNESLHYTLSWQSGLQLGDVTLKASRVPNGWDFDVSGTAGIPGFAISDKYRASTGTDLCSSALERETSHAGKKGREKTTFDQPGGTAHRETLVPEYGGKSDFAISSCARDAIAFTYYARAELGQGRVPAGTQIYFGSAYSVGMTYAGAQDINVGGKKTTTDHLSVAVKGPKSDFHFEVFYARDPARTPLEIRIPLAVGALSLDLVK